MTTSPTPRSGVLHEPVGSDGVGRRTFLLRCGCALASASLASLGSCAGVTVRRVSPVNGRIELPLAQHPELGERDGALRVQVPGDETPIYVLVTGDREFAALSPICTHLGCTVEIQGSVLVCPCHGSTYERTGRVVKGPAERALLRYRAQITRDDVLVIELANEGRNG
ncbi:MAG: ubiquinol-cytochrome c reductase iron-sulfur subunit [Gemmatimonadaceae bacterium]